MNYQQTLDFLYTRLPMYQRVGVAAMKYSLDNIIKLMDKLGNPQKKIKTIHIAGTNGKGSSSHMLSSVLQEAGYKTGLFTSPHLKSFTERIRINGGEISELEVVDLVAEIEALVDEVQPSFFELTFAMAIQHFYHEKVDFAVIEVGLGGRLDSTNIILPEISLITNISADHTQFLGTELPGIAREKAGIIKHGVPVVISEYQSEVAGVFIERADEMGSKLCFADSERHIEQAADDRSNVIGADGILLEGLKLDLKGAYQYHNCLGVLALLDELKRSSAINLSDEIIRRGLGNVVTNTGLKGRWQIINNRPITILDTGHNKSGIQVIIEELDCLKYEHLHIVWGMVDDKDIDEILTLLPKKAIYYFVEANVPRALDVNLLAQRATDIGLEGKLYPSVMTGYQTAAANALPEDLVFIGGSTFVLAEIDDL
jgi:dihydrofolate synthase / folylpolyglutamate synthase